MSKKQKIWFSVFMAMFLIPVLFWLVGIRGNVEIPWFPIPDFDHLQNILLSYFTTLVPFIGLLGMVVLIAKSTINIKLKRLAFLILIPLACLFAFLSFILIFVMLYYVNKVPQIG